MTVLSGDAFGFKRDPGVVSTIRRMADGGPIEDEKRKFPVGNNEERCRSDDQKDRRDERSDSL